MKKWLLVLGMVACMAQLTACGSNVQEEEALMSQEMAEGIANDTVSFLSQRVGSQSEESYIFMVEQQGGDGAMYASAFESWKSAVEDMGSVTGIEGITENTVQVMMIEGNMYPTEGTVVAKLNGETHDALLEILIEGGEITSISTNVIFSFGENMQKAGLNTLLGMGTVFVVLILISLIISLFGFIPKTQAKLSKKEKVNVVKPAAPVPAPVVVEEELSDDLELVAVIAAAVAASEGASSTDGFVVRSIRRAGSKWQQAGRTGLI